MKSHLRQRQAKTVMVELRWAGANGSQARIDDQEGFAVWDWQGIIYYELLPYGQTLNSDLYCQ